MAEQNEPVGEIPADPDADGGDYRTLFLLIAAIFILQAALPDDAAWVALVIILQGAALLLALKLAHADGQLRLGARLLVVVAVVTGVAAALTDSAEATGRILLINALLVALAPPALVIALRRQRTITLSTMFGALSIYLLIGLFFSVVYRSIAQFRPEAFSGAVDSLSPANFHYFSFITLATVGYGDITPATDLTRTLAVVESILGQLYLVTVVALVVSNLTVRRGRTAR
jgi:hypothetical protein